MYWLRWHYHVKDIAGAPYKIKKKERKKRKEKQKYISLQGKVATLIRWGVSQSSRYSLQKNYNYTLEFVKVMYKVLSVPFYVLTRDIDIAILSVGLSVCLSVRLSVTFRYWMKTA